VSRDVITDLLTAEVMVWNLKDRHPEIFGGSLWRDLLIALDALRLDVQ